MRKETFVTVRTTTTSNEAEFLTDVLRRAGLHPAEVALVAPLPAKGVSTLFPIEVPPEEAAVARKILKSKAA